MGTQQGLGSCPLSLLFLGMPETLVSPQGRWQCCLFEGRCPNPPSAGAQCLEPQSKELGLLGLDAWPLNF